MKAFVIHVRPVGLPPSSRPIAGGAAALPVKLNGRTNAERQMAARISRLPPDAGAPPRAGTISFGFMKATRMGMRLGTIRHRSLPTNPEIRDAVSLIKQQ